MITNNWEGEEISSGESSPCGRLASAALIWSSFSPPQPSCSFALVLRTLESVIRKFSVSFISAHPFPPYLSKQVKLCNSEANDWSALLTTNLSYDFQSALLGTEYKFMFPVLPFFSVSKLISNSTNKAEHSFTLKTTWPSEAAGKPTAVCCQLGNQLLHLPLWLSTPWLLFPSTGQSFHFLDSASVHPVVLTKV